MKGTYDFEALSKAQSDWRASQDDNNVRKDLFAALLEARDPETGRGLSPQELVAEAGILIVAGTDTTATSLTSAIFYVLHYPKTLSRLQNEIRSVFENMEDIRIGARLNDCKYLFACLDEAMRLSPGVAAVLQREILAGGLVVNGDMFPTGTDVGVSAYSMHHNSTYFPQPFNFIPERWLANNSFQTDECEMERWDLSLAQSAFTPFGVGRTSCVGKYLAYQEMAVILGRTIWRYDMRLKPGTTLGEGNPALGYGRERRNEFQTYEKFVSSHDGPVVQFKLRV
jgi:cytochrome P450